MKLTERHLLIVAGLGLGLYIASRGAAGVAQDLARGVGSVVGGVVTEAPQVVGAVVGLPYTNADKARALMDQYQSAAWADQAGLALQISGYASAWDYIRWTLDKNYRPSPGAY